MSSTEVQAAAKDLVADIAGPFVIPDMVTVTLTAKTSDLFAGGSAGGRRLLGIISIGYEIRLAKRVLEATLKSLHTVTMIAASDKLISYVTLRDREDMTVSVYVQVITASEKDATTTTTTATYTGCPEERLCFSQSCGSCMWWKEERGLECQKMTDLDGECICSCFFFEGNMSTPPPMGVTNTATRTSSYVIGVMIAFGALIARFSEGHSR